MDREGFDAETYVREVLGREGLEGVLRIEGALVGGGFFLVLLYLLTAPHYLSFVLLMSYLPVPSHHTCPALPPKTQTHNPDLTSHPQPYRCSKTGAIPLPPFTAHPSPPASPANRRNCKQPEIKSLDGERKALVYDNYSKLITATDTIRKMRLNMDPLTPTTSTLSPAMAHIAETASSLAASVQKRQRASGGARSGGEAGGGRNGGVEGAGSGAQEKKRQRQTVKWVLDAPRRLQEQVDRANKEAAEKEWEEVKKLLERWRGVEGVEEVRGRCERVLARN